MTLDLCSGDSWVLTTLIQLLWCAETQSSSTSLLGVSPESPLSKVILGLQGLLDSPELEEMDQKARLEEEKYGLPHCSRLQAQGQRCVFVYLGLSMHVCVHECMNVCMSLHVSICVLCIMYEQMYYECYHVSLYACMNIYM